ncbi:hypothetical protein ACP8H5_21275 [Bacillus subtilis]|uniref:hypothetical protein n=1 Tax=Bacillus subtilis TaxID=1423 RepID=UPI003CFA302B
MMTYKYHELFQYGDDKDVFEIIHSPVESYEGMKVVMKRTNTGLVMKENGGYEDDSMCTVVVPVGAITGATFKRVSYYKEVDTFTALEELNSVYGKDVFVKKHGEYMSIGKYTVLEDIGIVDFSDLLAKTFYVKHVAS